VSMVTRRTFAPWSAPGAGSAAAGGFEHAAAAAHTAATTRHDARATSSRND